MNYRKSPLKAMQVSSECIMPLILPDIENLCKFPFPKVYRPLKMAKTTQDRLVVI
jgi:hypothetical protein